MTDRLIHIAGMTIFRRSAHIPRRVLAALVLAMVPWAASSGPVTAASSPWLDHEQAQVRLLAAPGAAEDGARLRLGLHFRLQPGWKIYWRTPGEAGIPPRVDWSASRNLAEAEMRWPVPHRFTLFGLDTFGYSDEVVLPVEARVERPGAPVNLVASLQYLICSEICVPHDGVLRLDLPAGAPPPSADGFLIGRAESQVPGDGRAVGLSLDRAVLIDGGEAPVLEAVARSEIAFEAPDLLVEGPPGYAFSRPEVDLSDGGRRAVLRLQSRPGPLAEGVLEGKRLTLTLTDGARGMEQTAIARYAHGAAAAPGGTGLLRILALAVLGGLILNLMPCVLPVLSIKLLSVVKHGGRERSEVRIGFLASSAGILFSFLVLAAGAIALKTGGQAVGWGIQFQQPVFLTAMAVVLTLFAANLFGFFEIPMPRGIAGPAGDVRGGGLAGHFLAGAFATLLATPCSAPFLGTAVGFALARGAGEILAIFAALGFGLALPYLVVAAFPRLAGLLPRPGPWMITLRRVLGVALAATAAWLLTVLAAQVSWQAALLAGALLAALGLVLGLRRRLGRPRAGAALAGALALAVLVLPAGFAGPSGDARPRADAGDWVAFDSGRIAELVGDGRVVFVDVTADWCLTCQVNKSLVIESDAVGEAFSQRGVVRMRADWTLPDPEISAYLASFGRYGIPFNAVYGPGAPGGEALPELLSVEAVLTATRRAAGG